MKKALLVIDMQEMTVGEDHADIFKYPADIVSRVNRIIDENTDRKGQELGVIRQADPLTLSVLFYSSIQGFAETVVVRKNLKLPEKEWFLAILKNDSKL